MIIKSAFVTALGLSLSAPEDACVVDFGDAVRYLDATLPSAGCLDLEVLWK